MMPVLTADGRGIMIDFRQIVYIERRDRELIYHTKTDEYRAITSIEKMREALEPLDFRRLDKANVVNMLSIRKFDVSKSTVTFDHNGKEAYVSRDHREDVFQYAQDNRTKITILYHRKK